MVTLLLPDENPAKYCRVTFAYSDLSCACVQSEGFVGVVGCCCACEGRFHQTG
jgi:hypothetical protein